MSSTALPCSRRTASGRWFCCNSQLRTREAPAALQSCMPAALSRQLLVLPLPLLLPTVLLLAVLLLAVLVLAAVLVVLAVWALDWVRSARASVQILRQQPHGSASLPRP